MKAKHNSTFIPADSPPDSLRRQAEEARQLFARLFQLVPIPVALVSIDNGKFVDVNNACLKTFGYSRDEVIGKTSAELGLHVNPEQRENIVKELMATGSVSGTELRVRRKNGSILYASFAGELIKSDGEHRILGMMVDSTELQRAEERHRVILETALDGFLVADLEARFLEVNDSYCKMVGYSREELLTMSMPDIEAAETPEATVQHAKKLIKQGYDRFETRHQCKDGKIIDVEVSANYIDAEGGQLVVFIRDITERKQAEQALRESEGKYRTLVENIPQRVFLKDRNSVYISGNSNYAEDLKIKPEEISGHTDYDFYPRSLAEKYRADDRRILESGNTERFEEVYIQHGQEKLVETFKTPVRDESGQLVGVLGIFRDITEQKEMDRRRRDQEIAEARAEELSKSRRRLVSAQEALRKEIAGQLHGTVQNRLILLGHKLAELEAKPVSERTSGELADIRQKLEELQNDHIRPMGHRLFPSILRLGVTAGLESLVDEYGAELPIDLQVSKKLRDREQANRRLIPDHVKLALYRVAEEALANILQHTPAVNNIVLKLSMSDSRMLQLTVSDDGGGFDTASLTTGIGLTIVSDYAAAAGGSCTIKSVPGKGTRVTAQVQLAAIEAGQR